MGKVLLVEHARLQMHYDRGVARVSGARGQTKLMAPPSPLNFLIKNRISSLLSSVTTFSRPWLTPAPSSDQIYNKVSRVHLDSNSWGSFGLIASSLKVVLCFSVPPQALSNRFKTYSYWLFGPIIFMINAGVRCIFSVPIVEGSFSFERNVDNLGSISLMKNLVPGWSDGRPGDQPKENRVPTAAQRKKLRRKSTDATDA